MEPHRKLSINLSFLPTSAPDGELSLSVTQPISTPPQLPPPEHAIASAAPAASCKSRLPQNTFKVLPDTTPLRVIRSWQSAERQTLRCGLDRKSPTFERKLIATVNFRLVRSA
jgi:hypothetical protein